MKQSLANEDMAPSKKPSRFREWVREARAAAPVAGFGTVALFKGGVRQAGVQYPLVGVTVSIESGDALRKRVTLTRVVATGVFALALRKKSGGTSFMSIEGPDFAFVEEIGRTDMKKAQEFASALRLAVREAEAAV